MPRARSRHWSFFPYAIVAPSLLLLLVLFYPIVRGIVISLQPTEGSDELSVANYARLAGDERLVGAIATTFAYVVITASVALTLGLLMALILNTKFRGRAFARAIFLLPWVLPDIPTVAVFDWMLNPTFGVANYPLHVLGLENTDWLSEDGTALGAVIMMTIWKATPFFGLVSLAALQSVPGDLLDAAKVDGANRVRSFFAVTLPWIRPALATLFVLGVLLLLQQFALIWLLTRGGPDNATSTLPLLVYQMTTRYFEPSYGAAIGNVGLLIATIIAAVFVVAQQRRGRTLAKDAT
jgi:multiple sugar transport system permease protein